MLTDNCWIDPHSHSSKQVRHQLDFGGAGDHQPTTRGDCQHRRLLITENGLGVANRRGRRRGSKAGLAPAPKRKPIAGDKHTCRLLLCAARRWATSSCLSPTVRRSTRSLIHRLDGPYPGSDTSSSVPVSGQAYRFVPCLTGGGWRAFYLGEYFCCV